MGRVAEVIDSDLNLGLSLRGLQQFPHRFPRTRRARVRALNTDGVWAALRAEANDVLGDPDDGRRPDEIGPEQFRQLAYASAVVHESLRLHPAGLVGAGKPPPTSRSAT